MKIEIYHIDPEEANSGMFEVKNIKVMNINMGFVIVQIAIKFEGTWLELFKNRKFLDFLFSLNIFKDYSGKMLFCFQIPQGNISPIKTSFFL